MEVNAVSRYQNKQKKIWFNIITLNILTLIIGGCAYYYYETSTLIKSLNTKIEQQNQTIDQQHHAQTALIDANHSLQQQLEENRWMLPFAQPRKKHGLIKLLRSTAPLQSRP